LISLFSLVLLARLVLGAGTRTTGLRCTGLIGGFLPAHEHAKDAEETWRLLKNRAIWDMAPVLDSAHGPMDWTKPTLTGKQASLMQTSRSFAVCSSLWIRKLGIKAVQCGIAQKTVDNLVFYTRSAAVSY